MGQKIKENNLKTVYSKLLNICFDVVFLNINKIKEARLKQL